MPDDLADSALALLGLALFVGLATHRAEHAIVHDLRRTLHGGALHADVRSRGLFGLAVGEISSVKVTGSDLVADEVPFSIKRGPGIRANAARLEFDLRYLTLRGTTVRRFSGAFPTVSLDAGRAFFDERIILRRAGEGIAVAEIAPEAIVPFIEKKYPVLKDVQVELRTGAATVRGSAIILGTRQKVEATGRLVIRDGRYLDLGDLSVLLNGRPATAAFAANVARSINPVVDIVTDLGLGRIFLADDVEIGEGYALVRGRAHLPEVSAASPNTPEKRKEPEKSDE